MCDLNSWHQNTKQAFIVLHFYAYTRLRDCCMIELTLRLVLFLSVDINYEGNTLRAKDSHSHTPSTDVLARSRVGQGRFIVLHEVAFSF